MKVALPIAADQLCTHFGHCERFYFYEVDETTKKISKSETFTAPPHEPGLLPRLLSEKGTNVVIAGGMGVKAQELFGQNGIKVVIGADPLSGSPEEIVRSFVSGSLRTGNNPCDH